MRIGDDAFWKYWAQSRKKLNKEKARELLAELMTLAQMPADLSGKLSENQWLVARFSPDLPPHHAFWRELSQVVNIAFPNDSLSRKGSLLKRQIHQFRYVISSQQAQYIRLYYKKKGMTDAQALAAYLRKRRLFSYYLNEPARLHNKLAISQGKLIFPGGKESYNIKVLTNRFHSEFILTSDGRFLNEVDAEEVSEEGVVNGASFNYGQASRHWALDVKPVVPHDPEFRNIMTEPFRSPKNAKKKMGRKLDKDYDFSYFNQSGIYAKDGKSHFKWVKKESQNFKKQIGRFSLGSGQLNFLEGVIRTIQKHFSSISQRIFSKKKR